MNDNLPDLHDYEFTSAGQETFDKKGKTIFIHASLSALFVHLAYNLFSSRPALHSLYILILTLPYAALLLGYYRRKEDIGLTLPAVLASLYPFLYLALAHIMQQRLLRNQYYIELGLSLVMAAAVSFLNNKRLFRRILISVFSAWVILLGVAGFMFIRLNAEADPATRQERGNLLSSYVYLTSMIGLSAWLYYLNLRFWEESRSFRERKSKAMELINREAKQGLFLLDPKKERIKANPSFYRIRNKDMGYGDNDVSTMIMEDVLEEDLARTKDTLEKLKRHDTETLPLDFRIKAGETAKWVRMDGIFTSNENQKDLFLGSLTDINSLKKAEEKARSDTAAIKALLMAGQIYPWQLDYAARQFHLRETEKAGSSPWIRTGALSYDEHISAIHEDYRPIVEEAYDGIGRGEKDYLEVDYLYNKRGTDRYVWLRDVGVSSERDEKGRTLQIAGFTMDIDSDRRRELRIDQALRASGFVPWRWQREEGIAEFDPRYTGLLGMAIDDNHISQLDFFNRMVHREDRSIVKEFFVSHLRDRKEGLMGHALTFRLRFSEDGDYSWFVGKIVGTQYDKNGFPLVLEGIFKNINRDIKRDRQLSEEKREREIADTKNRIFSTVSHDLLTPMNGLTGTLEQLNYTELDRSQKEILGKMDMAAELLLNRIHELLDISDLDQGGISLRTEAFSPKDMLDEIVSSLENTAMAEGVSLILNQEKPLPGSLKGDSQRLRQIVLNLVRNGIKFTPRGKVVLSAEVIEETPRTCRLRISVLDEGIGIPSEKLASIFEPFGQVDRTRTREHDGIGLSLAINKQLVELMGGLMGVRSSIGKGSEFFVEIPLERVKADRGGKKQGQTFYPGGKILVIDDNPMNREIAADLLAIKKISVITAAGGQEGLDAIAQESPHLVFMDIQMPGMDGYTASRLQREREGLENHIPIIALTANATEKDKLLAYRAGMDGYLTKPVDMNKIEMVLEKWLEKFRTADSEYRKGTGDLLPIPGIDMKETLERFDGEYNMLKQFLRDYLEDYRDFGNQIRALEEQDDSSEIYARIHALKGVSGSLGITEVFRESRTLSDRYRESSGFSEGELNSLLEAMKRSNRLIEDFLTGQKRDS